MDGRLVKNLNAMIGITSPYFTKYIIGTITFTKTRPIPPLEMGKKLADELKKLPNTPNNQALRISQILE
jgi:hypothetical protein